MRKKLIMFLTAFTLIFSVTSIGFVHDADAKGYRSGKRSYSPSQSTPFSTNKNTNTNRIQQEKKNNTFSNSKSVTNKTNKGGFMKGMLLGGLGGLLIGNLFGGMGMGAFGSILAGFVNVIILIGVIMVIVRIFSFFKRNKTRRYN
ncbi:hypothetical protein M3589_02520 [Heyndrickxia oleronia]|uniref:hypothetical protein n=1 Tax=Heyndrickxia oleronia TaxID=38875 RepID=UPI00203C1A89|nr:hypothetical protein [Heyndrickxia oleronia]MCM3236592.1 hypothetical protein [Heyndrickxia oleronia]